MSLKISNLATDKQVKILQMLEYSGRGRYALKRLTVQQAAELIDELFEQKRLEEINEQAKYGNLADLIDPFNPINK